MLDFFRSLKWLELILANPTQALQSRLERPMGKARRDFSQDHLIYYVVYFILLLFSPYLWYKVIFSSLPSFKSLVIPPILCALFLVIVTLFDRLLEFRNPTKTPIAKPQSHNRALFLSIPVSASLFFFLLHPLFGYLMLIAAATYSMIQIVRSITADQQTDQETGNQPQLTTGRIFALFISFCGIIMLPFVVLLMIYNLIITTRILTTIF